MSSIVTLLLFNGNFIRNWKKKKLDKVENGESSGREEKIFCPASCHDSTVSTE